MAQAHLKRAVDRSGFKHQILIEEIERRQLLSATLTTLAMFDSTTGWGPSSKLVIDASGNLLGTTQNGGSAGDGTIFSVNPVTKTLTTDASFDGTHGTDPVGGLLADGNGQHIGATNNGGATNRGAVYLYDPTSKTISDQADLTDINGSNPVLDGAAVNDTLLGVGGGVFYGVTSAGGTQADGTIFKYSTGSLTPVVQFVGANGSQPFGQLIADSSGNPYGTTSNGGTDGVGTVFELNYANSSAALVTLASFNSAGTGANPRGGPVLDSSGNLFGTTIAGGANGDGTVYEIDSATHTLTAIATFNGTNGSGPYGSLLVDSVGNLFGTTNTGGTSGDGTVFEITAGKHSLITLVNFSGSNGAGPQTGLTADPSGNLFGDTRAGGSSNIGTVFEITGAGFNQPAVTPAFTSNPSAVLTGHSIAPAVTISEEDSAGSVSTSASGSITIALSAGSNGTLAGTLTEPLVSGVATFSDLKIDTAGTYTLTATDGVSAAITSTPFTVTQAPVSSITPIFVKSTLPTTVVAGSTHSATVVARLSNASATLVTGKASLDVYLSQTGGVAGSSVLIGSAVAKLKLKTGAQSTVTVRIKSFPTTLLGNYTVFLRSVDPAGVTNDLSAGTTLVAQAPVSTFSETITRSTLPATVVSGTTTTATAQVKISQMGNIPSKGPSTVAFLLSPDGLLGDATLIKSEVVSLVLKPGASRAIAIPLKHLPSVTPGSYQLVAEVIDSTGQVTTVPQATPITVQAPVVILTPAIFKTTIPLTVVPASLSKSYVLLKLTNNGNVASTGSVTYTLYLSPDGTAASGTVVGSLTGSLSIKPGAAKQVKVKTESLGSLAAGQYALVVVVTAPLSGVTQVATPIQYMIG